jgi:TonB family protein
MRWFFMGHSDSGGPATEVASTTTSPDASAPAGAGAEIAQGPSETQQGATTAPPSAPLAAPSNRTAARAASSDPDVLHEEIPNVSLRSRETIHGHVKVIVRVTVDKSGAVVSDVLENPGPSKYFARLAGEAASKWKFVPADRETTRQWLVRFEFSRDGTKAHAVTRN